jgi:hypothetical protein
MCTPHIYLFGRVLRNPNGDQKKKKIPREFDVSTTPIWANKPFGVSSSGVRVLDVYGFLIYSLCEKAFGASF